VYSLDATSAARRLEQRTGLVVVIGHVVVVVVVAVRSIGVGQCQRWTFVSERAQAKLHVTIIVGIHVAIVVQSVLLVVIVVIVHDNQRR
jgi:hypothetical protein